MNFVRVVMNIKRIISTVSQSRFFLPDSWPTTTLLPNFPGTVAVARDMAVVAADHSACPAAAAASGPVAVVVAVADAAAVAVRLGLVPAVTLAFDWVGHPSSSAVHPPLDAAHSDSPFACAAFGVDWDFGCCRRRKGS